MRAVPSRQALQGFAQVLSFRSGQYRCLSCMASQQNRPRNVVRRSALRQTAPLRSILTTRISRKEAAEVEREKDANDEIEYQINFPESTNDEILDSSVDVESHRYGEAGTARSNVLDELDVVEAGLEHSRESISALEDELVDASEPETQAMENEDDIEDLPPWYLRAQKAQESNMEYDLPGPLNRNPDYAKQTHRSQIEGTSNTDTDSAINMMPWYLRPQESDSSLVPQIDIQKVTEERYPDLPFNSPPILQPLVSRLFYDHHLADIVILDLRNRWPPPVWGSETIMVLANARSERQLTSVAETTAKWLKQTAGVTPRIDGLPRKETLVLKRRRLRRKAMLKPGYMAMPPKPTTWVSMYTGYQGIVLQLFTEEGRTEYDLEGLWGDARIVDAEELDMKPRKIVPGGFEEEDVVETWRPVSQKKSKADREAEKLQRQDDKRREKRAVKRRWTNAEKQAARDKRIRDAAFGVDGNEWPTRSNRGTASTRNPFTSGQRREFHTSRQSLVARQGLTEPTLADYKPGNYSRLKLTKPNDVKLKTSWWKKSQLLPDVSDLRLRPEIFEQFVDALKSQPPFAERDDATDLLARTLAIKGSRHQAEKLANLAASKDPASLRLLSHFGILARFTREFQFGNDYLRSRILDTFKVEPFKELGFKWALDFFMRDMPIRCTAHHYHMAIMYYLNLTRLAPDLYPATRILDIMLLAMSQGIQFPRSTFHLILNHIATERPFPPAGSDAYHVPDLREQATQRFYAMTTIIKHMKSDFGLEYIHDEEIYLALYRAANERFLTIPELMHHLHFPLPFHPFTFSEIAVRFFADKHIPKSPEFFMLEVMGFAHRRKWRSFLKRWQWLVRFGVTKDADLWTIFWACLARGQEEFFIRWALTEQFPEMMDEGEGLRMTRNIGVALNRCLEIVDPERLGFAMQWKVTGRILEAFPE